MNRRFHIRVPLIVELVGILILVMTISLLLKNPGATQASSSSGAVKGAPTNSPQVQPDQAKAIAICDGVFRDRLILPAETEKQAMVADGYRRCVEAATKVLPPEAFIMSAPVLAKPMANAALDDIARRPAGAGVIVEFGAAPLPGQVYTILNSWYEKTPDKSVGVYAGGRRDDAGAGSQELQGVIVIRTETTDHKPIPAEGGEYLIPAEAGLVRIADAQGEQLTVVAEDGSAFFFDLVARQFVTRNAPAPFQRSAGAGVMVESGATAFSVSGYEIENQWFEDIEGYRLVVLAGAMQGNKDQGVVIVAKVLPAAPASLLEEQVYPVPVPVGAVRLAEVDGGRLTLAATGGPKVVFDLAQRQFVYWPDMPSTAAGTPAALPAVSTPVP